MQEIVHCFISREMPARAPEASMVALAPQGLSFFPLSSVPKFNPSPQSGTQSTSVALFPPT